MSPYPPTAAALTVLCPGFPFTVLRQGWQYKDQRRDLHPQRALLRSDMEGGHISLLPASRFRTKKFAHVVKEALDMGIISSLRYHFIRDKRV